MMQVPVTRQDLTDDIRAKCGDEAELMLAELDGLTDDEVADCCSAIAGIMMLSELKEFKTM